MGWWDRLTLGPARRRREIRRRLRELDRRDARYGLHDLRPAGYADAPTASPGRSRERRRKIIVTLVTLTVIAVWIGVFAPTALPESVRSALGVGPHRLRKAAPDLSGPGAYKFIATQPGDPSKPVTYDPCQTFRVVVNTQGAPDGAKDLVRTAIDDVNTATGLHLVYDGTSDERPGTGRSTGPILVAWAQPSEVPILKGDIAGIGGSTSIGSEMLGRRYVTGQVTLDAGAFDAMASTTEKQAILDHEFGHLVGLDHVSDRDQLMYRSYVGVNYFANGDLKGLALLGRGRCF